jgi:hypothetical protein
MLATVHCVTCNRTFHLESTKHLGLNVTMEWITILAYILEVTDSDIGPDNDYPESAFLVLPFAARARMLTQIWR